MRWAKSDSALRHYGQQYQAFEWRYDGERERERRERGNKHFFFSFLPSDFNPAAFVWMRISSWQSFICFISWVKLESDLDESSLSRISAPSCSVTTLDVSIINLGSWAAIASETMRPKSSRSTVPVGFGDALRPRLLDPLSLDIMTDVSVASYKREWKQPIKFWSEEKTKTRKYSESGKIGAYSRLLWTPKWGCLATTICK